MCRGTVHAVYFSATGTTKTVVTHIAETLRRMNVPGRAFSGARAAGLDADLDAESDLDSDADLDVEADLDVACAPVRVYDFTRPDARTLALNFYQSDVVVVGLPVYAGRLPNLIRPYLELWNGGGALAIPVVVYGNRAYDDALYELRDILSERGFFPIAAGAFVGEHSFSTRLGAGRPDAADMEAIHAFARSVGEHLTPEFLESPDAVAVPGRSASERAFYQPKSAQNKKIDIRRVKPKTLASCTRCGYCAEICPMGAIDASDVFEVPGICIKCGACVKRCPEHAKVFDDPGYLYHLHDLEAQFERRAEPEVFFSKGLARS